MTAVDEFEEPLVVIRFKKATVKYLPNYEVEITGNLWPRQLHAAHQMIAAYKECTRQDARDKDKQP